MADANGAWRKQRSVWRSVAGGLLALTCFWIVDARTIGYGKERLSALDLIAKLRSGGYNLYVRHAATDWSQSDKISRHGDWTSCDPAKVRQLSDAGRQAARSVGQTLRRLGVRLGAVFASPYCRTLQTARLMSQRSAVATNDLMNLRSADFVGGRDAVVARARTLLAGLPARGVNDLFVAHGNLGRAAFGETLGEGDLLILKPGGKGSLQKIGVLTLSGLKGLIER